MRFSIAVWAPLPCLIIVMALIAAGHAASLDPYGPPLKIDPLPPDCQKEWDSRRSA